MTQIPQEGRGRDVPAEKEGGLTEKQSRLKSEFREFTKRKIVPYADRFDREERVPDSLIASLASRGYLGAIIPGEYGGMELDMLSFGYLNEELGRGCASVRSLLTVHSMVSYSIMKWGSHAQKKRWLPRLSEGSILGAFALSEPGVGSDARNVECRATRLNGGYSLRGRKKWITFGQIADLFLVVAQLDEKACAFLVERGSPGLTVTPIQGMLGARASMLAELALEDCIVPGENFLGREGLGFETVVASALDVGRFTVAWGCVGLAQACLEASLEYSQKRIQFGSIIFDHQLIRKMISEMVTGVKAARLLCKNAASLKEKGDPASISETLMAKYFSSTMVSKAARDAVQIHGACGLSSEYSVQRYYRDAKIMEIIEGSSQIHEMIIAKFASRNGEVNGDS